MHIDILTLFPEMFAQPFSASILGKAQERGLVSIKIWNIRDFAEDRHRIVDDTPYGGGAGMVLKPDVTVRCIEQVKQSNNAPVIFLTPQGQRLTQQKVAEFAGMSRMILLCGHYEGIDERVRTGWVDEEISIGDYVLTGGELPAMVLTDAVVRLIPGVLGDYQSAVDDSFASGLLEHPHYTRPFEFRGLKVPKLLISGHHDNIRRWRLKESLRRTMLRRPDILEIYELTTEEQKLLEEIVKEEGQEGR